MSLGIEDARVYVQKILEKAFPGNAQKQKIYASTGRLNFSCPYCGDSNDPRKKRGNLYSESLSFKCYNGGCGIFKDFVSLLRDFDYIGGLTQEQIDEIRSNTAAKKNFRRSGGKVDVFLLETFKDVLVSREDLKKKLGLTEIPSHAATYLRNRYQEPDQRYLWEPNRRSLFILNLTSDGNYVLGLQIRNMSKYATNKYFTYKLSGIHKNLLKSTNPELLEKSQNLDPISCVFGFSFVDLDSEVTVFEGPFDSFLYPNAVALCSINNEFPFDIENKRYFLDSDTPGREKAKDLLLSGNKVFLWGKYIKDNDLPEREKWDLNDLVVYARKKSVKIKRLDNYFSNDKWDLINL